MKPRKASPLKKGRQSFQKHMKANHKPSGRSFSEMHMYSISFSNLFQEFKNL
jgi:hypothetical protein